MCIQTTGPRNLKLGTNSACIAHSLKSGCAKLDTLMDEIMWKLGSTNLKVVENVLHWKQIVWKCNP